jgi:hypothetical protein
MLHIWRWLGAAAAAYNVFCLVQVLLTWAQLLCLQHQVTIRRAATGWSGIGGKMQTEREADTSCCRPAFQALRIVGDEG